VSGQPLDGDAVTVGISASADRVYDLVSDVTRMGEWSPECYRCEWTAGATGPSVGARFKVVVADRGREFAFSRTAPGAGEYVWSYTMAARPDGGTDLTESYRALRPESRLVSTFVKLFTPGDEPTHLRTSMTETLERIRTIAEAG
jgi:uncharacterized protein YndB with AHSA1/START domain